MEYGILGFGIQNTTRNPEFHCQRLESGNYKWNPESGI